MYIQGDPTEDFFEQNPEVKVLPSFQTLIKKESKKVASKLAWAIYLYIDPKSPFFEMLENEREELVQQYLGDSIDFDQEKYAYLIAAYENNVLERQERLYQIWSNKAEELTMYLNDLDIGDKNVKGAIDLFTKMDVIWEKLDKIKERFEQSKKKRNKPEMRGGLETGGLSDLRQSN